MQLAGQAIPPRPIAAGLRPELGPRLMVLAERAFTMFYVILGMSVTDSAYITLPRMASGDRLLAGGSDPIGMIGNILVLACLIPALWMQRGRLKSTLGPMTGYVLIMLLCVVSTLWSPFPFDTLRKSINLSVCVIFGVWLYLRFGLDRTLKIAVTFTLVGAIVSVALYFAVPSLGHETNFLGYENALRGVFPQKNVAGEAMLAGLIAIVYLVMTSQMSLIKAAFYSLIFFAVEVMSMSASAVVVTLVVWTLAAFLSIKGRTRLRLLFFYGVGSVAFVFISILLFDPGLLFDATGRDASLTGRVPLWHALLPYAKQKFLLGWGYAGFFNADSLDTQAIWANIQWTASNAHNGYLDILLQIGAIGLALYAWVWWVILSRSYVLLRATRFVTEAPAALWCVLFMISNITLNIDEGPLPYQDQFTMLMPPTILAVHFAYLKYRELHATKLSARRTALRPRLAAQ